MKLRDLHGLDEDLARQTRQTKKMGGPSNALRQMKKRPDDTQKRSGKAGSVRWCRECGNRFTYDGNPIFYPDETLCCWCNKKT